MPCGGLPCGGAIPIGVLPGGGSMPLASAAFFALPETNGVYSAAGGAGGPSACGGGAGMGGLDWALAATERVHMLEARNLELQRQLQSCSARVRVIRVGLD